MGEDVRHDPDDQEPELRLSSNAPAKKSLSEFLAEFEERLANDPDEAATGALRAVKERAAGLRRSPAETSPAVSAPMTSSTIGAETGLQAPAEPPPEAPPSSAGNGDSGAAPNQGEVSGESRRLRGRRRRKHRHRAH
jgi:hypothetical protein